MLYPNMRKTFISKMSLNDHYKPLENSTKYSVWVLTVHCRMVVNEVNVLLLKEETVYRKCSRSGDELVKSLGENKQLMSSAQFPLEILIHSTLTRAINQKYAIYDANIFAIWILPKE